jgi:5-methylcytosine-specific restriction endonuclease McrA
MSELEASEATSTIDSAPPLEWLETQICELAGHLAAATGRFLVLLGDFDARRGWAEWDLPSCSAWLSWKCQLASGTAREHVRVARAMRALPAITAEFAAGRMSYAKVRALTRIATPENDADLAELAGPMTASQVERFARAHRQVSQADDDAAYAERRVRWHLEDDGSLAMSVRLPPAEGAVVLQALRAAARDLDHPHAAGEATGDVPVGTPAGAGTPSENGTSAGVGTPVVDDQPVARTSLADALVDIASGFLAGKIASASNPDIYQVIVHVGQDVLTGYADVPAETPAAADPGAAAADSDEIPARSVGHPAHPRRCHIEDGPAISPATVRRMACQAALSWMLHDHDGTLLDVGRRHRRPTAAQRRAVRERDRGRCQFPGCQSRRTDIHHIKFWSRGGPTNLINLMLLCEAHHVIVHALGYLIAPDPGGGFTFTRPDGTPMPASPQLPVTDGDITASHDATIEPSTIVASGYGDRFDLHQTIWACFANAKIAEERRARDDAITPRSAVK